MQIAAFKVSADYLLEIRPLEAVAFRKSFFVDLFKSNRMGGASRDLSAMVPGLNDTDGVGLTGCTGE